MLLSSISCTCVCAWARCSVCFMQRMFWGHTVKERGVVATCTSWPGPCHLNVLDDLYKLTGPLPFLMRCSFTTWTGRTTHASWVGPCVNEMQWQVTLHFISLKNTISWLEQIEPLVSICFTTHTTGTSWVTTFTTWTSGEYWTCLSWDSFLEFLMPQANIKWLSISTYLTR